MISKCANPTCDSTFDYRSGRLFRFPKQATDGNRPANSHSVQHFWLCAACSQTYSLEYDERRGVAIRFPGPSAQQRHHKVISAA